MPHTHSSPAHPTRHSPAHPTLARPSVPRRSPDRRSIVAVDLENLVGGSDAPLERVASELEQLHRVVPGPHHWVVAVGPTMLTTAMPVLGRHRVLLGRGNDGADRRLVEVLQPDEVVGRYAAVVLVSGDGRAFTEVVRQLAAEGVPTDVVAPADQIGHSLRASARSFTAFESSFAIAA